MNKKKTALMLDPTDTVISIFTARRDLLQIVRLVVAGSGLSVEEADLMVMLYGIKDLEWTELPQDADGYIAFKELESYLVHNPSLLSRRIRKLAAVKPPLVEVAEAKAGSALHFNALRVRITAEGIKRIKPVWDRYTYISAKLVHDISPRLLEAHYQVNEEISTRIQERRWSAKDLQTNP